MPTGSAITPILGMRVCFRSPSIPFKWITSGDGRYWRALKSPLRVTQFDDNTVTFEPTALTLADVTLPIPRADFHTGYFAQE